MTQRTQLKDGREVEIRNMQREDLEASIAFFAGLSDEDRRYLRRDVTKPNVVAQRLWEIDADTVRRIVAVVDGEIVADGSVELSGIGWKKHVGELRLIVARSHRRNGLGVLMARELYGLAAGARVEEIIVKMMRPQKAARAIFRKLGFSEEVVLEDYVKDVHGERQDLILMRCDLENLWRKMENLNVLGDWSRTR
jgi:L-amino acid N-acyltransferase YncA